MARTLANGICISKSVYKNISPIFLLSRIYGLCPVSIVERGNYCNLIWSRKAWLCGFAFAIFLVSNAFYGLVQNYSVPAIQKVRLGSLSATICTLSDNAYLLFTHIAGIVLIPIYFPHFITFLDRIDKIDSLLPQKNLNQVKRCVIVISVVLTLTFVALVIDFLIWLNVATKGVTWITYLRNKLPLFAVYAYQMALELHFWLMVHFIRIRLACLNDTLKSALSTRGAQTYRTNEYINIKLVHTIQSKNLDYCNGNMTYTRVKDAIEIHHLLYEAAVAINEYFGVYVLIILIGCILHLLVTPYDLYSQLRHTEDHLFIACQLVWLLGHILRLIFIIEPCEECEYQTRQSAALACKQIASEDIQYTKTQLQMLLQQIEHCPIRFTAYGLVDIDRPLLATVVGTVTTYLVILFQFNKMI